MQAEIEALEANNTWSIVPLPPGKVAISSKWVYKVNITLMAPLKDTRLGSWPKGIHRRQALTIMRHSLLWLSSLL